MTEVVLGLSVLGMGVSILYLAKAIGHMRAQLMILTGRLQPGPMRCQVIVSRYGGACSLVLTSDGTCCAHGDQRGQTSR